MRHSDPRPARNRSGSRLATLLVALGRRVGRALRARTSRDSAAERPAGEAESVDIGLVRLAAIVDSSDDAIVGKTLEGTITSWNRAAERMFGYRADEAIGQPIKRLIIPAERHAEEDEVLGRIRNGLAVEHYETVRRRKDGRRVDVAVTVSPIKDRLGRIVGASKIARDITERKRGEAAALFLGQTSEALLASLDYEATLKNLTRLAVPAMADFCAIDIVTPSGDLRRLGMAHVDPDKERIATELLVRHPLHPGNPYGVAQVIRSRQPLLSREPPAWIEAEFQQTEEDRLALRTLGVQSVIIVPLVARDRVLGAITLLTAESGRRYSDTDLALATELARRAAFAIDNARLYREAQRALATAEEANRAKDEFLATLSHELRTPLTAVLGWARMLQAGTLDEPTMRRAVDVIARNAAAQAELIEDLLDMSRIITGKMRLDVRPVDLPAVVEAAIDSVRPAAAAKEIRLSAVLDPRAAPVMGDADRLQQVVWNMLSNSVKFTPKQGSVHVELHRAGSQVTMTVRDTGHGIDPAVLPYVFDRFRQGDSTTTRTTGGLGIGLALARHLVELHGGVIAAASEGIGRGATFSVRLPMASVQSLEAARPHPGAAAAASEAPPATLTGLRVLVVDDDRDSRDLVEAMLSARGAVVAACASAAEARERLAQGDIEVLVSDIEMPEEDGYDLIRTVRSLPGPARLVPAVALTAYGRVEDRTRALRAGFNLHVAKPVDPAELAVIVETLRRWRAAG